MGTPDSGWHYLEIDQLAALRASRKVISPAVTEIRRKRIASLDYRLRNHAHGMADSGVPMGFRLIAVRPGAPALVRVGAACQGATTWHRRHPAL